MTRLGIDYGGTKTKLMLVSDEGEIARDTVSTGGLRALGESVGNFLERAGATPASFALTVAGTLDPATGVVGHSANLPWLNGTAPAEVLSSSLGVPGVAVQDGEAAALAEARFGAGRGGDDVFVIALGTGIAGAHVVGGRVRRGAHGAAGEIGHMRTTQSEVVCSCGQRGCLETAIGGSQLADRWRDHGGAAGTGASAQDVVAAARAGDGAAVAALDDAAQALARALLDVCALIDPGLVVIGGGVARSPEWTVQPAVAAAGAAATFHRLPPIELATLGVWAGARGAAEAAAGVPSAVSRG
ncbi:ROK family protein [Microbacterium suaedae]|uniref:ROK family protein n=1 Tax=Microbacterium suaedae TaxID=2067813 RepID=UPI000DA2334A|nr:ROK family protein [Microbacterium suaedae]